MQREEHTRRRTHVLSVFDIDSGLCTQMGGYLTRCAGGVQLLYCDPKQSPATGGALDGHSQQRGGAHEAWTGLT